LVVPTPMHFSGIFLVNLNLKTGANLSLRTAVEKAYS
jgi:hypothetical protein